MPKFPGFIGASYLDMSLRADRQRAINLYPEVIESGSGQSRMVLHSTPGLALLWTIAGPVRCLWSGGNRLFAVGGGSLYEVTSGTPTVIGSGLANDGKPAEIHANGNSLFVVAGGKGYIHTGVELVNAPVPADDLTPLRFGEGDVSSGAFLDGFYIAARPNSAQINVSHLYDGQTWDASAFENKEGYTDHVQKIFADHGELWIFGTETTEVWRNTGNRDFPFERDPGAFIHLGLHAKHSVTRFANSVGWLGMNERGGAIAYLAQGYVPVRVSTHAVENEWKRHVDAHNCVAYSYEENGHVFWVLNFSFATWVYDLTTKMWHQRAYSNGAVLERHRGNVHTFSGTYATGSIPYHFIGDYANGSIYRLTDEIIGDNGAIIRRIRTAPYVTNDEKKLIHHRFELEMDVITATGNIDVAMRWSENYGETWSPDRIAVAADLGRQRVVWRRLGASYPRVYEIDINELNRVSLIEAYLDVTPCDS